MQNKQPEQEDEVKLKSFIGIRPGVWLTFLYSIFLTGILFFLFVFPGLKNPGSVLIVKTEPKGAAIRINDTYMGVSGNVIFVPRGIHTVEAVLPGFNAESAVFDIRGRVFASLFFPRREKIEFTLEANNPDTAFAQATLDYASWSFGGEPTVSWQIPLSLSEAAYRIGPVKTPETDEILTAASRFTVTRAALRDIVRAKILLDNSGISPSPVGLLGSVSDIIVFLSENSGSSGWLTGLLPPESSSLVRASAWNNTFQLAVYSAPAAAVNRFQMRNCTFLQLDGFWISENPVSRSVFEIFLEENPEWKEGFTDYFKDKISFYSPEFSSGDIISGITWYTAEAFCQWLTKSLPASMAAMEVRLPSEAEWEYAAKSGINSMENAVWEWCADPFAPLQFIKVSPLAAKAAGSPERLLRGKPSPSAEQIRASLPPDLSSPFVTFRPIIAQRAGNE